MSAAAGLQVEQSSCRVGREVESLFTMICTCTCTCTLCMSVVTSNLNFPLSVVVIQLEREIGERGMLYHMVGG